MITPMSAILSDAKKNSYAVGCFNAINLEMARGIVRAAEDLHSPVILAHAEVHLKYSTLEEVAPILTSIASAAKVPVAILYDHGKDFGCTVRAMQLGFNAVMYDGSRLPKEENIANTAEIVKIAHAMRCEVEGELGSVMRPKSGGAEGNDDDSSIYDTSIYTDPDEAADYVERTKVDCLAVAFGTVHGVYLAKPKLDLDRLRKISSLVDIPLVMHGGSGLSEEDFANSIASGIRKINYYTDMALSTAGYIRERLNGVAGNAFYHDVVVWAGEKIYEEAAKSIRRFGSEGRA